MLSYFVRLACALSILCQIAPAGAAARKVSKLAISSQAEGGTVLANAPFQINDAQRSTGSRGRVAIRVKAKRPYTIIFGAMEGYSLASPANGQVTVRVRRGRTKKVKGIYAARRTAPAEVCEKPAEIVDTGNPNHVVGDGTPQSCTEGALKNALASGGVITFNCGSAPVTISVTSEKKITKDTVLDGGGLITLDGGGKTRILNMDPKAGARAPANDIKRYNAARTKLSDALEGFIERLRPLIVRGQGLGVMCFGAMEIEPKDLEFRVDLGNAPTPWRDARIVIPEVMGDPLDGCSLRERPLLPPTGDDKLEPLLKSFYGSLTNLSRNLYVQTKKLAEVVRELSASEGLPTDGLPFDDLAKSLDSLAEVAGGGVEKFPELLAFIQEHLPPLRNNLAAVVARFSKRLEAPPAGPSVELNASALMPEPKRSAQRVRPRRSAARRRESVSAADESSAKMTHMPLPAPVVSPVAAAAPESSITPEPPPSAADEAAGQADAASEDPSGPAPRSEETGAPAKPSYPRAPAPRPSPRPEPAKTLEDILAPYTSDRAKIRKLRVQVGEPKIADRLAVLTRTCAGGPVSGKQIVSENYLVLAAPGKEFGRYVEDLEARKNWAQAFREGKLTIRQIAHPEALRNYLRQQEEHAQMARELHGHFGALRAKGYHPESCMAVLFIGFRHIDTFFFGDHRLTRDSVSSNLRRGVTNFQNPAARKLLDTAFDDMQRGGLITILKGGASISVSQHRCPVLSGWLGFVLEHAAELSPAFLGRRTEIPLPRKAPIAKIARPPGEEHTLSGFSPSPIMIQPVPEPDDARTMTDEEVTKIRSTLLSYSDRKSGVTEGVTDALYNLVTHPSLNFEVADKILPEILAVLDRAFDAAHRDARHQEVKDLGKEALAMIAATFPEISQRLADAFYASLTRGMDAPKGSSKVFGHLAIELLPLVACADDEDLGALLRHTDYLLRFIEDMEPQEVDEASYRLFEVARSLPDMRVALKALTDRHELAGPYLDALSEGLEV